VTTTARPVTTDRRIVVGLQPVREAIRVHGAALDEVLVSRGDNPRLEALLRFARSNGVSAAQVPRSHIDKLCGGVRHQGALAFAPPLRLHSLSSLAVSPTSLVVVLDGITDPQNFGATIRSAVALEATAVVWGEHGAAPLTPATFRASAGAVEHATLCRVRSVRAAMADLAQRGFTTVALDAGASVTLASVDMVGPTAIAVGAEDTGVSRGLRRQCIHSARLPIGSRIDSLNASVAAALALYECRRQREASRPETIE
jgi:23S rRNA (guanosine2251-2'-O)-methyltransferase